MSDDKQTFEKLVLPFGTEESDCVDFAEQHLFGLIRRTEKDEDSQMPLTLTFAHGTLDTSCQFVNNYKLHVWLARCYGSDREKAANLIRSFFYVIDEQAIREEFASDNGDNRSLAMAYLGEYAPAQYEPNLMDLFSAGAKDASPDVREATFLAIGIVGWRELLPVVDAALAVESDEYLRQQLEWRRSELARK
jgi:hypothetical protein